MTSTNGRFVQKYFASLYRSIYFKGACKSHKTHNKGTKKKLISHSWLKVISAITNGSPHVTPPYPSAMCPPATLSTN